MLNAIRYRAARTRPSQHRLLSTVSLSPEEVVAALDKHIVGQKDAKAATAIALRDQWRRQQLPKDLQREVLPNNILMVGPTGVGKTEVARRLARLADAPFVKVEATKYTEVGIYGADTESMVSDLVEVAATQVEERERESRRAKARERAIETLVQAIGWRDESERDSIRTMLRNGTMGDTMVEVELRPQHSGGGGRSGGGGLPLSMGMPKGLMDAIKNSMNSSGGGGRGGRVVGMSGMIDVTEVLGGGGGRDEGSERKEKLPVSEALPRLEEEELDDLMDELDVNVAAIEVCRHLASSAAAASRRRRLAPPPPPPHQRDGLDGPVMG